MPVHLLLVLVSARDELGVPIFFASDLANGHFGKLIKVSVAGETLI